MPHEYLRVWIAMLSKTDATGYVRVSPPAMARLCHLNREEFDTIIEAYCAPDPESRTEDHEGRRLAKVEGGWQILNYVNYREGLKQPDSSAGRMRKLREKKKCDGFAVTVTVGDAYAEAEAEAEAEAKSKYKENTPPTPQGGSRVVIDPDSPAGELLASQKRWEDEVEDIQPEDFTSIGGSRECTYEEADRILRECGLRK
jgi:hypothetical protein